MLAREWFRDAILVACISRSRKEPPAGGARILGDFWEVRRGELLLLPDMRLRPLLCEKMAIGIEESLV